MGPPGGGGDRGTRAPPRWVAPRGGEAPGPSRAGRRARPRDERVVGHPGQSPGRRRGPGQANRKRGARGPGRSALGGPRRLHLTGPHARPGGLAGPGSCGAPRRARRGPGGGPPGLPTPGRALGLRPLGVRPRSVRSPRGRRTPGTGRPAPWARGRRRPEHRRAPPAPPARRGAERGRHRGSGSGAPLRRRRHRAGRARGGRAAPAAPGAPLRGHGSRALRRHHDLSRAHGRRRRAGGGSGGGPRGAGGERWRLHRARAALHLAGALR